MHIIYNKRFLKVLCLVLLRFVSSVYVLCKKKKKQNPESFCPHILNCPVHDDKIWSIYFIRISIWIFYLMYVTFGVSGHSILYEANANLVFDLV